MLYTILGVLLFVVFAVACAGLGRSLKPVSGYASVVGRSPCTVFWIGLIPSSSSPAPVSRSSSLAAPRSTVGRTSSPRLAHQSVRRIVRSACDWIASSDSQYTNGRERRKLQSYSWGDRLSVNIYYEAKDGSSDLLTGETLQKLVAAELALLKSFEGQYGSSYGVASSGGDLTTSAPSYLQEMLRHRPLFMEKTTNKWYYSGVLRTDVSTRVLPSSQTTSPRRSSLTSTTSTAASARRVARRALRCSTRPAYTPSSLLSWRPSPSARPPVASAAEMGFDVSNSCDRASTMTTSPCGRISSRGCTRSRRVPPTAPSAAPSKMHWSAYLADEDFTMADQDAYVVSDATISLIALAMVFLLILVNTREGFVSFMGWLSIFLCFPISFVPYYVFLGVRWMGILNLMTLFIIFGIGADDIFVLRTMWEHSMPRSAPRRLRGAPQVRPPARWRDDARYKLDHCRRIPRQRRLPHPAPQIVWPARRV